MQGVIEIDVLNSCGCWKGTLLSIIFSFMQLNGMGLNLEFGQFSSVQFNFKTLK